MKLIDPTDDQLDATFAEHVAGWRKILATFNSPERWAFPDCPPEFNYYALPTEPPKFTRSADAVLPWLDKVGMWKAERFLPEDICRKGVAYRVDVANRHACDFCHADDDAFPRAAVIALLRAHGVEVEFTK